MTISDYLNNIARRYNSGISREHSYRGDLQLLLETLAPDTQVANKPAHIACGAPDYVLTKKDVPIESQPELVEGRLTNTGKVWINEAQYFAGVPQTA